jgi:hypothetical protein
MRASVPAPMYMNLSLLFDYRGYTPRAFAENG